MWADSRLTTCPRLSSVSMMIRRGASSEGTLDFELDLLDPPLGVVARGLHLAPNDAGKPGRFRNDAESNEVTIHGGLSNRGPANVSKVVSRQQLHQGQVVMGVHALEDGR